MTKKKKTRTRTKTLPRELHLKQRGAPFTATVFPVIEDGELLMRIDNAGPFSKRECRRLVRWIDKAFMTPRPLRRARIRMCL